MDGVVVKSCTTLAVQADGTSVTTIEGLADRGELTPLQEVEICGLGPSQVAGAVGFQGGLWESALVRVHPTGKANVFIGASPHGQGEETTFAPPRWRGADDDGSVLRLPGETGGIDPSRPVARRVAARVAVMPAARL